MATKFDSIVVGSSPVCMIEAICLAESGRRVALLERKDHLGGAWACIDSRDFADVEYGTHIIFPPDPEVYQFLQDQFQWDLIPMTPPPELIAGGRKLNYCPRNERLAESLVNWQMLRHRLGWVQQGEAPLRHRSRQTMKVRSGWFGRLYDEVFRPARDGFRQYVKYWKQARQVQHPYLYTRGGAPEILERLIPRLHDAGVEVHLGAEVDCVDIAHRYGPLRVQTSIGEMFTRDMVLTTCSDVAKISVGGRALNLPEENQVVHHLHLYVDDPTPRAFSYLIFEAHSLLRRVSDVTRFAQPLTPDAAGRKAICVWLRPSAPLTKDTAGAAEVLRTLVELGYFPATARMADFNWSIYGGTFRAPATLARIRERCGPCVRVFDSKNLCHSVSEHMMRWNTLLAQSESAQGKRAA